MAQVACGIDIGGSGVKGALVDLETGEYIGDQVRIPTPTPATPDAVAAVCREVIDQLGVTIGVPIGVTFPAPVFDGVIPYMANLDQSWVNVNVDELMERYLGRAVVALTTRTRRVSPRSHSAQPRAATASSCSPPRAPESARRLSSTALSSPTPSSATSRSTAPMRRRTPPRARRPSRA